MLASYELAGAGYSPKKLRAVARELKGSVYSALFFLRFLRKRSVAKLLTEFLTGVYCDVRTKHAWADHIVIVACWVGRGDTTRKLRFAARGRAARLRRVKSNLKLLVGLS
ncbi:putative 50S ribosomal subunit protein L22 [Candidatus Hodgkinia cicadicola Dsem]|nr:putative 50S ribosomal subunit protein L22 [Candidatus Hodgkinia cicadicola Dsem]